MADLSAQFFHSTMVDENFLLVAAHVDEVTQNKIKNGEYVNFSKLLPRDRVLAEEETRLQLIQKNGHTYWVPEAYSNTVPINSFARWEQAFRVFSDIYCKAHPHRSWELIQYNHVIHTASLSYYWDNVYLYDKDFRIHLSHHPSHSWAIILQQSWTMCMKDKIKNFTSPQGGGKHQNHQGGGGSREPCRCFNRGKCTFGASCRYNHKCSYKPCGKFGHGYHNCRKRIADEKQKESNNSSNTSVGTSS